MRKIDDIDSRLLALIQDDDRQSMAELGKALGIPASTVNDRLRRLRKDGVIAGYHARVSPDEVGLNLLAFVMVGWSNPKVEPLFLATMRAIPDVLECHHVAGSWNYLLKVRVATTNDLERFLVETIKKIDGVDRTETLIVLSAKKETWALDVGLDDRSARGLVPNAFKARLAQDKD